MHMSAQRPSEPPHHACTSGAREHVALVILRVGSGKASRAEPVAVAVHWSDGQALEVEPTLARAAVALDPLQHR